MENSASAAARIRVRAARRWSAGEGVREGDERVGGGGGWTGPRVRREERRVGFCGDGRGEGGAMGLVS